MILSDYQVFRIIKTGSDTSTSSLRRSCRRYQLPELHGRTRTSPSIIALLILSGSVARPLTCAINRRDDTPQELSCENAAPRLRARRRLDNQSKPGVDAAPKPRAPDHSLGLDNWNGCWASAGQFYNRTQRQSVIVPIAPETFSRCTETKRRDGRQHGRSRGS